jgi:hypothetical protein
VILSAVVPYAAERVETPLRAQRGWMLGVEKIRRVPAAAAEEDPAVPEE